jgi:TRAP-type C4-dicarboxylate transport system substrate-binding protein
LIRAASVGLILLSVSARAEPVRIRMAALAPEGTPWAREFHNIDRDIQDATGGEVSMKWYLGGIAGDELEALERVRRGQLDGVAGALFCDRLAPSIRVGHIVGLFQSRAEWRYVMSRLLKTLDGEFAKSGFVNLGIGTFGNVLLFSRRPIASMSDLRRDPIWSYDLDEITSSMLHTMGIKIVPAPVDRALKAWDDNRVDGFVSVPAAALAFQWSSRARYFSDLPIGELPGCFVIATRAFDALPLAAREKLQEAVAKFTYRFDALGQLQDDALLGGLFERQGVHKVPADAALKGAFLDAARVARDRLPPSLISPELLARTQGWLADFRSEQPSR